MNRRDFLRGCLAVAGTAAIGPSVARALASEPVARWNPVCLDYSLEGLRYSIAQLRSEEMARLWNRGYSPHRVVCSANQMGKFNMVMEELCDAPDAW